LTPCSDDYSSFPYAPTKTHTELTDSYYLFALLETWTPTCAGYQTCGYLLPWVAKAMPWIPSFRVDHDKRIVSIPYSEHETESVILAKQLRLAREQATFRVLEGWRNELYPVFGLKDRRVAMERSGSALFGIETRGVHCTAYTWATTKSADGSSTRELKFYVPRRSATKSTYPGMLDNSIAGGISSSETVWVSMLREAQEEGSLPYSIAARAKPVGTVSYIHLRDSRAGGEVGLLQPEIEYCFDLELSEEEGLKPNDDEVAGFELMGLEEVWTRLCNAEFKPNCGIVLIDLFIRWGLLRPGPEENLEGVIQHKPLLGEKGEDLSDTTDQHGKKKQGYLIPANEYHEIVSRLHRRCVFEEVQTRLNKVKKA
jgi:isopentenyldiphosphate isomerase